MTSALHLQEPAEAVLERMMNFAPDGQWTDKESRMQRVVKFMEQRHFLSLARGHGETDLAKRITEQNRFLIRLTNMIHGVTKLNSWKIDGLGSVAQLCSSLFVSFLSGPYRLIEVHFGSLVFIGGSCLLILRFVHDLRESKTCVLSPHE